MADKSGIRSAVSRFAAALGSWAAGDLWARPDGKSIRWTRRRRLVFESTDAFSGFLDTVQFDLSRNRPMRLRPRNEDDAGILCEPWPAAARAFARLPRQRRAAFELEGVLETEEDREVPWTIRVSSLRREIGVTVTTPDSDELSRHAARTATRLLDEHGVARRRWQIADGAPLVDPVDAAEAHRRSFDATTQRKARNVAWWGVGGSVLSGALSGWLTAVLAAPRP